MENKSFIMRINYIFLVITVFLVFGNTVQSGYNYDDELVTRNNEITKRESSASIKDIFSSSYHDEYGYSYGYRPITTLSFFLEHKVLKENSQTSHAINLVLYIITILLLYYLLTNIFNSVNPYILFFIALMFALHSVHSEVVSSIKNRDEILSLLFLELTILFSFKWFDHKKAYVLILIALGVFLSILSKKSSVSIIALLPILFYLKFNSKFYSYLIFSFCFSLPIAFSLFNFDYFNGLILMLIIQIVYVVFYYLKTLNKRLKFFINSSDLVKWLPLIFSLLFLVIGWVNMELIFWLFGILTLIFYLKINFTYTIAFISFCSFLGYLIFESTVLIELPIFLLSGLYFTSISNLKNNWYVNFSLIIILLITAYTRTDWAYFFIFLIPLLVFISSHINKNIPILISSVSLIISIVLSQVSIFQFGLVLFSILPLLRSSKINKVLFSSFWLVAVVLVSGFSHVKTKGSLFQTIEQKQEIAEQYIEKSSTKLQEGRQLEYMENTLVAPHTLEQRIATGAVVLGEYFRLMIFPKELSFYYGYSKIQTSDFTDFSVWLSLLIHLVLFFLMVYTYQKHPLVSFGLLWYFAAILLFSNWPVLVAGMVGERLAFIASVGFCIAIGGVLNWIKPNFNLKKPKVIELVALSVLVLFSIRTIARNRLWESPEKLMSNDITHLQNSAQANYMLAMTTVKDVVENSVPSQASFQRLNGAIQYFQKAIEVYPDFYNYHYDLGRTFVVLENYREAKNAFEKAYKLEPDALISLDELVKASFDLNEYADVIKYGKLYLNKSNNNYIIYELVAYSAYLVKDYQLARELITEGLGFYPNNQNLNGLLLDVNNADQQ